MDKETFTKYVFKYLEVVGLYLNKKPIKDFKIIEEELSFFIELSKRHSLTALLFKVLENSDIDSKYLKPLEEHYFVTLRKAVLFERERKELYEYLNNKQINYLPLKGIVLKDYYLDPYTREFADNDILFDGNKDKLVRKFFKEREYSIELFRKSNHDVYMKKPSFNFEMHRSLFGENGDNTKVFKYFDRYLKVAPIKEGYEHYLKAEDFYIYFTAHTYKHFSHSGCGLRTVIDYYLFLKNNELDFDYINKELSKLSLDNFSNLMRNIVNKVFDQQELNDEELQTLLYIASSGTYGTLENAVRKGVKEKGKFRYFMSRIFPPMYMYKSMYPWAYKTKVLIPVAWIIRFFRILFTKPGRAIKELRMIRKAKKQNKDKIEKGE